MRSWLPFLCVPLAPIALAHCEPPEPPATAANAQVPEPGPPIAPPLDPAQAGDDTQYASGEYTIGEDADSYDDNDPAALRDFHPALDSYGTWADDATYGTVWTPAPAAVGADFTPYVTAGHWVYDDDWVWVSDYPWGWAPYHYGRWVLIEGRGWAWVPGRVYRGAWVVWGVDDGWAYVGWAPAPLEFVWFGGVAVGWHGYLGPRWVYCPRGAVFAPGVGARVIAGPAAGPIASRVHPYVVATPGVPSGPPPQRLGFTAAQIPHATGPATASVAQARQFSRPSTAQPLGASAASRVTASRPAAAAPLVRSTPSAVARTGQPRVYGSPSLPRAAPNAVRPPVNATQPSRVPSGGVRPAPAPHFSGGGGGHHR